MPGTLFVVSTPIGNLQDITLRALDCLRACDLVVCEDTRTARKLLSHFGLKKQTISNFAGNEERRTGEILDFLREGKSVALTTDAGTPGISDPGYLLVRACRSEGIGAVAVPGPSALGAALAVGGLPATRVLFLGFPPRKAGERRALLQSLAADPSTLVFYESPARVRALARDLREHMPGREIVALRELTKKFESVYTDPLPEDLPERGEYVFLAGPPPREERGEGSVPADVGELVAGLVEGGLSEKEAMKEVARASGVSRRDIYQALKRRER